LRKIKTPTGILYTDVFFELPERSQFPDYYELISKPIAIVTIIEKLERCEYNSVGEFVADWDLLFSNSRVYNEPESWVCKFATILENELVKMLENFKLIEATGGGGGSAKKRKR